MGTGHLTVTALSQQITPGQEALFTGTAADFLTVFPEAAALVVPHSSLFIHPFATHHTRDQKAQHRTQETLYSWGAEVRHKS